MFSLLACGPIAQRYFSSGPICATALVWGRLGPRVEALAQAVAEPAVELCDQACDVWMAGLGGWVPHLDHKLTPLVYLRRHGEVKTVGDVVRQIGTEAGH